MNNIEIAFFGLAVLLPLVGGGALLYFLSRDAKKADAEKRAGSEDETKSRSE